MVLINFCDLEGKVDFVMIQHFINLILLDPLLNLRPFLEIKFVVGKMTISFSNLEYLVPVFQIHGAKLLNVSCVFDAEGL